MIVMRRIPIVLKLLVVIVVCTWHSAATACGFPDSYNKLREVMTELGEFKELQENRRHERLRIRMRKMDYTALNRSIRDMGIENNANEVHRLLYYAEGLVSGMSRVDLDEMNTLLLRVTWLEGKACALNGSWFDFADGKDGTNRGKYVLPVLGFLALCGVLTIFFFGGLAAASFFRNVLGRRMVCLIPARILCENDSIDVEVVTLDKSGCALVPADATVRGWGSLLVATGDFVLEIGDHLLPCSDHEIEDSQVVLHFQNRLSDAELKPLLEHSSIKPSIAQSPVFAG